jgi:hypothetical protein
MNPHAQKPLRRFATIPTLMLAGLAAAPAIAHAAEAEPVSVMVTDKGCEPNELSVASG